MKATSTPTITSFDPHVIPYQYEIIKGVRKEYDYSLGLHEILMSGSVGSAKSTLISHIAVTHCLMNEGARFMLGRLSMPALRATLFSKTLEHIGEDLKEGVNFWINQTTATIKFKNGSEIISRSWSDKKYFKVRSLELSGAAIDEIVETETQEFYNEIKMRVGRLPHIKENIIINATNPDSPSHWVYKYFIEPNKAESNHPTRHVFYSRTEDNPFLPNQYIDQLKRDLDPKLARRMLYGEWLEIASEVIYYAYDTDTQYLSKTKYEVDPSLPIWLSWDFNIGEGKPMSVLAAQQKGEVLHVFKEWVTEGMRTQDSLDEIYESNVLDHPSKIMVTGDAAGKHRDTRSSRSDYDIIRRYLSNAEVRGRPVDFEMRVLKSNPPVRTRHNKVNAFCKNVTGETRLYVHKGCKTVDEGLRLTQLKKGGMYIEDDSKYYQHITTALGYLICVLDKPVKKTQSRQL